MSGFKVTYATLAADDDELHAAYDIAVEEVGGRFGGRHPSSIGGEVRTSAEVFRTTSPVDRDVVIGEFAAAPAADVADAVGAAVAAAADRVRGAGPPRARHSDR